MLLSLFPDDLRSGYDTRVLNVGQRAAKARQLRRALVGAGLWQPPTKILDVACGSALILAALDAPKALRVGCDVRVEPFLRAAVDRASVAFVRGDASCLPFRRELFDLVICLAAIEEFLDWRGTVETMAQCVAPGGVLYVTITNGRELVPLYALLKKIGVEIGDGQRRYAKSSLRIAQFSAEDGFGIDALRGWRYVNITPHLARARLPILCPVPISVLAWILEYLAPSFGRAWQRPLNGKVF